MNSSHIKNSDLWLLCFAVGFIFFLTGCQRGGDTQTLADLGPEIALRVPDAGQFTIRKDLVRHSGQKQFRSLEAVNGSRLLKVEVMAGLSREEAQMMQEERMAIIRSLFSNLPSPYPGMVTNTVVVADEMRPQLQMVSVGGQDLPLYILMSSSRYTYGAVPTEMVSFLGGLFFIFDESSGTLYRLDYFLPKEEFSGEAFVRFFSELKLTGNPQGALSPGPDLSEKHEGAEVKTTSPIQSPTSAGPSLKYPGYNLILIAFEPLGASHMSSYGYSKETTPNLDAFAKDALLFENAVSPSSWSLPVFMTWFTSLYPSQHKVTNQYSTYTETEQVLSKLSDLSPETVTLPKVMQKNGYRTAGFVGGASLAGEFGFNLGFARYFDKQRFGGFDLLMPKAVSWLTEMRSEKLFLFLEGYDVHGQFPLSQKHLKKFLGPDYHGNCTGTSDEYWQLRNRSINEGAFPMSDEDIRFWNAVYDTKIFDADARFGIFMEELKQFGLLEKSIIVVSAGSGNEHHEHGRIDHGFSLYEELLHVPLIVRIPGQKGGRISQLVRTIDIMPTVLDLLDLPVGPALAKQMQGVSLEPVVSGKHLALDGISETNYLLHTFKRSIKTEDGWKLIVSLDTEKRELYFLKDDPHEQHNVVQENGRIAYKLEQRLFEVLRGKPAMK